MITKDTNILIVGLGLIGGSYALGLSKQGYQVNAIDIDQASIEYALDNNLIKKGSWQNDEQLIREADLIIMALYPLTMIKWINDNQIYFKKDVLITDVSGVKSKIVATIQNLLTKGSFIASHPMAGKEVSGAKNSDDTIFYKANFIITPTIKNNQEEIAEIKQLAQILNFKQIVTLSCEKHDEMIGFLSQLTHVIAMSLMNCREIEHLSSYTGDSFRDLVRIAKINEEMWSELFLLNKDKLLNEIDNFILEMQNFRKYLADEDVEKIKSSMIESTKRKVLFDQK